MQDEKFDDLIRQKLQTEEESVSAGLWSRVEADLPVAKQDLFNKKLFWLIFNKKLLWLILLLLIPASAGWYYFTSNQTEVSSSEGNNKNKLKMISNIASEVKNTEDKKMQNNAVSPSDNHAVNNSIKNNSGQINYSTRSTNNIILPKTLETTKVITATTDFSNQEEINEWDLLNPN